MKLRQKVLLVFVTTLVAAVGLVYLSSRRIVLSSFRQLEDEQMRRDVQFALSGLDLEFRNLADSANDYAYWDRMYEYMLNPKKADIRGEFLDKEMEQLNFNLVVVRNTQGEIVFLHSYDRENPRAAGPPPEFLRGIFSLQPMQPAAIALMPQDGLVQFPDGPYVVSLRPILTSRRSGQSRGVFMLARKFDDGEIGRLTNLTRTSITVQPIDSKLSSPDFWRARAELDQGQREVAVIPLSERAVAGYAALTDIFHKPLLLMRVETPRPIYERGQLDQRYLFGTILAGAALFSVVILLCMQRFVLSRIGKLSREVHHIGERKGTLERVQVEGGDELAGLGLSINVMLDELQRSQEQLLLIAENIDQAFWVRDARSGAYDYASRAFEKVCGISPEALSQHPQAGLDRFHLDDRPLMAHALAEQMLGQPTDLQFRVVDANGNIRWLWERTFPVCDRIGRRTQTAGLTEDTTEFKKTEHELRTAQSELEHRVALRTTELAERGELVKLLLDSTPSAMYGVNLQGVCTFCNPAALRLLGYDDVHEIMGKNIHTLMHPTRRDGSAYPQAEWPIMASLQGGDDAQIIEETFWRKNGDCFVGEYSSRRIRRNDFVVGAVVTFVDTTNRKQREMEANHSQKLEAVGRLAAGIAHEINTPVQFVSDNARFLMDAFKDSLTLIEKYQRLIESTAESYGESSEKSSEKSTAGPALLAEAAAIQDAADWPYLKAEIPRAIEHTLEGLQRVATIVRGMKEFSHVDRSNEKAPGDINRALESTLIVARNELKYVADVETEYGELPLVNCHLGDLNQVFLNLMVNAAHAIGDVVKGTESRGTIRIATRQDGDWAEIAITDSGAGIPEEVRHKIFDPFFSTKEVGKGTGQGLALARNVVVDKHGGTLTFATAIGKGTTFWVRLPLQAALVPAPA